MSDDSINEQSLALHKTFRGKINISIPFALVDKKTLSLAYTPGVAQVSKALAKDPQLAYEYSIKSHTVAVVSDGSAVLGLGNIGPYGALPVMEGKAALFKAFGGVDAYPLCLDTQDPKEIISIVKAIAPTFGGINLEDIKAPQCFQIEEALQELGIPVFHDDQHGTAIVVMAALINASKVTGKPIPTMRVAMVGAGAAGTAIAKLLAFSKDNGHPELTPKEIIMCDTKGIIGPARQDIKGTYKEDMLAYTNASGKNGTLADMLKGADVFIGVSSANLLTSEMIKSMNVDPIVFAMANPVPEISYDAAKECKVAVLGTGRSDYPNQINNVLAFPGIFKGALQARAKRITVAMKIAAAIGIASCVEHPTAEQVIPDPFDQRVPVVVAEAVIKNIR